MTPFGCTYMLSGIGMSLSAPPRVDNELSNGDSWREMPEEDVMSLLPGIQDARGPQKEA